MSQERQEKYYYDRHTMYVGVEDILKEYPPWFQSYVCDRSVFFIPANPH